jgi:exosortase D (VPLPA-CTERM-specific)
MGPRVAGDGGPVFGSKNNITMVNEKSLILSTPFIFPIILIIGFLWIYLPILTSLFSDLASNEDYSFGLLIPFVSGYIVYLKWPQLQAGAWRPSWLGLIFLALGLFLTLLGQITVSVFIQRFSFLVALAGLIFVFGGWSRFKQLGFPFLLLALMIPGPVAIMKQLTIPLQLTSSSLAASFLQVLGIPAVQQGNVIDLGRRQLQVVQACSGLRYILSLMALGIIYCYFYQRCLWKAALLLILLIPAAIGANALRLTAIGIFPALQEGFLHQFSGWLIFLLCFAFMGLFNWLLKLLTGQSAQVLNNPVPPKTATKNLVHDKRISSTCYVLCAITLLLIFAHFDWTLSKVHAKPLLQDLDSFPLRLGDWQGRSSKIADDLFKATGAETYFNAEYTDPQKHLVSLWIAYYGRHSQGVDLAHNPKICLVGSGWRIIDSKIQYITAGVPVNALQMAKANIHILVYYWHLQQGHWLANMNTFKFFMGFNGLFQRRTDWALFRLITLVESDPHTATQYLNSFARLLIPVIPQFIQK